MGVVYPSVVRDVSRGTFLSVTFTPILSFNNIFTHARSNTIAKTFQICPFKCVLRDFLLFVV